MDVDAVPATLRERLGPAATGGLLHVLDLAHSEWRDDVMSMAGERFERRLVHEASGLRVQIAQTEGALRTEIAQSESRLRSEIGQVEGRLRQELGQVEGRLRQELDKFDAGLRQELGRGDDGLREDLSQMEVRIVREAGNSRFELLKWSFGFWIGQVVTMSAIIAAMLRIIR